jgi:hypothetical protein
MVQVFPDPLRPSETFKVPLGVPVNCGFTVALTVALCPSVIEFGTTVSEVVLLALLTVCESGVEVLPALLLSPLKAAVTEWAPRLSEEVLKTATPETFTVPVPSVLAPSLKVTASPVPEVMGVPPLLTVAANVIDWP